LGQLAQLVIANEFVLPTQLSTVFLGKLTPQRATHWLVSGAIVQSKSVMQYPELYLSYSCCRFISYSFIPTSHGLGSGTQVPQHCPGGISVCEPDGHLMSGQLTVQPVQVPQKHGPGPVAYCVPGGHCVMAGQPHSTTAPAKPANPAKPAKPLPAKPLPAKPVLPPNEDPPVEPVLPVPVEVPVVATVLLLVVDDPPP
jgi:hypothetical protein